MKARFSGLGGRLGMGCVALGVLVIGLGWNGAASVDFAQGQIPYLLSGGAFGLAFVVTGAALLVVESTRRDRAALEAQLREVSQAVNRLASVVAGGMAGANGASLRATPAGAAGPGAQMVAVGQSSYHRPDCRLIDAKDLPALPMAAADEEGLEPCRVCHPDQVDVVVGAASQGTASQAPATKGAGPSGQPGAESGAQAAAAKAKAKARKARIRRSARAR